MKRNFDEQITDLDGKPVRAGATTEALLSAVQGFLQTLPAEYREAFQKDLDEVLGTPLTFGAACVGALMGAYEDEKNLADGARLDRMELARRIHKGGVQEITPKDRDLIKPLVKKRYSGILVPVVVGELLEKEVEGTPVALASVG